MLIWPAFLVMFMFVNPSKNVDTRQGIEWVKLDDAKRHVFPECLTANFRCR
jgi:hypothetical protein